MLTVMTCSCFYTPLFSPRNDLCLLHVSDDSSADLLGHVLMLLIIFFGGGWFVFGIISEIKTQRC